MGEVFFLLLFIFVICFVLLKWRFFFGLLLLLFLGFGVRLFFGVWVNIGVCLLFWSEVFVCGVYMLLFIGDKFEWEEIFVFWMFWFLVVDNVKWCLCGVLWVVLEDCKFGIRVVFGWLFVWLFLLLWLLWFVLLEGSNEVDLVEWGVVGIFILVVIIIFCFLGLL